MKNFPVSNDLLLEAIKIAGIRNTERISIRETVKIANILEQKTNQSFIRLEMGVPGLPPPDVAVQAEHDAALKGLGAIYPPIDGVPELKAEASRFAKLFIDVDIPAHCILPATGSMQATMAAFLVANRTDTKKTKTLFIDPGFPVNKAQLKVLGMEYYSFDVYNYRGEALKAKLIEYLEKGDVATILYSSPNNPSWISFTERELEIIGSLAQEYGVIVLEDLAYFGMDLRHDISVPGVPPFNPTVAKYTRNYILLLSGSKTFSYAGQRIAVMMISPELFNKDYPDLLRFFGNSNFGHAMIFDALYTLSTGTTHTTQYGFAAILEACNNGSYIFVKEISEYSRRAAFLKKLFLDNNFKIVYDKDGDADLADGFYFTVEYPGMTSTRLSLNLLRFGIATIGLNICNSDNTSGLRICVSQLKSELFPVVEDRLSAFAREFVL